MKKISLTLLSLAVILLAYFIGGLNASRTAMRQAHLTDLNNLGLLKKTLEREGPEKTKEKIRNQIKGTLEVFENFQHLPLNSIYVLKKPDGLLWSADAEEKIIRSSKAALE